jgi:Mrp family chromosome partitioning ATPase/capsule polysaccharide export protein KpsE/RkpR
LEIREYLSIIWKRKLLIVISMFLLGFLGIVINYVIMKATYQATAKILVEPKAKLVVLTGDRNASNMPPSLDIETYVKMLKSHRVGEAAAQELHKDDKKMPDREALQKQGINMANAVVVEAEEDTGIIKVSVQSKNPEECTDIANAYVRAFVGVSKQMTESSLDELESYVEKQLAQANLKLKERSQNIKEFQDDILAEHDTTNPDLQETELDQLIRQLENERMYANIEQKALEVRLRGFAQLLNQYDDVLTMGTMDRPGWDSMSFTNNSEIDDRLRELELERISLQERFVEGHPKLAELDGKIELLENQKRRVVSSYVQGRQINNQRYEHVRDSVDELEVELALATAKIERIEQSLEEARGRMVNVPEIKKQKMDLERDLAVAESMKTMLEEQLIQLQLQRVERPTKVQVLDPAIKPSDPISPQRERNVAIAIIIGLLLGVGLAFLLEEMEETVRTSDDVKNYLNLPVLGSIPYSAETINKLITDVPLKSPIAEAYRRLSFFTQLFCLDPPIKSLLVTSCKSDEGKSTTLSNMAISMAQEGTKVLIIDTDLRRPMLHRMFGIDNSLGLSSILTGELEAEIAVSDMSVSGRLPKESFMEVVVDRLIQPTNIKGLSVIPSGPLPANSIELLRSERMLSFLRTVEKKADIVIFDSPPSIHVIDAVVMAQILDGVLMVINSGRIDREEALQVKYMIESTKTPIIGVALNNIEASSPDYYYYYYYGGYGYGSRQRRKRVKLKR